MRFEPITMDGLSATMFAIESFTDMKAALHGPGGCRNFHSFVSKMYGDRITQENRTRYNIPYFFGQPRIPCTYIDEDDYINGSEDKLKEAIPLICDVDGVFTVFIKSPGASLIGDSISDIAQDIGYADRLISIEESLVSIPYPDGYDRTVKMLAEHFAKDRREVRKDTAVLVGLPITFNDALTSAEDLSGLLGDMGIEVIAVPGCGASTKDLEASAEAEYCICVCPEFGAKTSAFYAKRFGMEVAVSEEGAPVGFDATEAWVRRVAEVTGKDPGGALARIERDRHRAFVKLAGSFLASAVKCETFAVVGESSVVYPLTKWLHRYLNMVPVSVNLTKGSDPGSRSRLEGYLAEYGLSDVMGAELEVPPYAVIGDGNTALSMKVNGECTAAVNLCAPSIRNNSFLRRPVFGSEGALYILDEIFDSRVMR